MASSNIALPPVWVQRAPPNIPRSSMINLVNLLLRETPHRITVLQKDSDADPELFVVTQVEWRNHDSNKPLLPQLPRILSLLETLRGSRGVPRDIYLESTKGIIVYLPTGIRLSVLPKDARDTVQQLLNTVEESVVHTLDTMKAVEDWFWKIARRKGFSPEIVERMANSEPHYNSTELHQRFHEIMRKYFSLRFRIHTSESCLHVEVED
ncbi:MAG: hypothetical protein ACXAEB_00080 [Candidatus Thorarchaeota archaeon]